MYNYLANYLGIFISFIYLFKTQMLYEERAVVQRLYVKLHFAVLVVCCGRQLEKREDCSFEVVLQLKFVSNFNCLTQQHTAQLTDIEQKYIFKLFISVEKTPVKGTFGH